MPAKKKKLTEEVLTKAAKVKTEAEKALKPFTEPYTAWFNENRRMKQVLENYSVDRQRERWKDHEAYPVAAFRLAVKVCSSCHQLKAT